MMNTSSKEEKNYKEYHSIKNLKKSQEKDDKEQEYYAGGNDGRGGGSGQATIGPPKARGDIFDSIVSKAHESSTRGPPPEDGDEIHYTVTMWQNGFQVNDGPFRSNEDESAIKFIAELERGIVPTEIRKEMKNNGPASFALNDKRDQKYVPPPPPAYVAFSHGTALGASNSTSAFMITPEIIATHNILPSINESEPNTTLQFRTIDGRRLRIKLNNNATIMDIISAANAQGVGNESYILSAGFPPKDLTDPNLTLTQADLIGAAIVQKKA